MTTRSINRIAAGVPCSRTNGPTSASPDTNPGCSAATTTAEPAAIELPTIRAGAPSRVIELVRSAVAVNEA